MEFLRKRSDYIVNHTKSQAINELKKDPRIDTIRNGITNLVITTIPIIPRGFKGDEIFIYPVGVFKITINMNKGGFKSAFIITNISVKYRNGHQHLMSINRACWGGFETDMEKIKKNRDWYWAGKRCLDFINDFGREHNQSPLRYFESWVDSQLEFQLEYMKDDLKVKKKLIANKKKYIKKYKMKKDTNSVKFR